MEKIPMPPQQPQPSTSRAGGPKEQDYKELGESSKRKRTQSLRQGTQTEEIVFATEMKLREEGRRKEAKVLKKVTEASPRTVDMIFLAVEKVKRTASGIIDDGSPKMFSLEEAVVHQIECDFSKEQYILNRKKLITKNCDVFPSYEKICQYKKKCVHDNLSITEQKAWVSLQNLLDHTAAIIVEAQDEVFKTGYVQGTTMELISKIGFDASSNQSVYNQLWKGHPVDDSTIVLTALVPLLLHQKDDRLDKVNIIWMNQKPSSVVNCRPLQLEFSKETTSFIKAKAKELREAISNLEVTIKEVQGVVYEISHRVQLTMVDGKVSSAMTDTGSATCNVCQAKPSQMNDIDAVLKRECNRVALEYGLSVLHLNIRFLEYFLNIAKRVGVVEKCYGKYTAEQTAAVNDRHKTICQRLKQEVGLNIDQPTSKGGNTNTGNNARRFFNNAVKVASITGLDLDLLQQVQVLLKVISCGYAIDIEAFRKFSHQLARDLVSTYKFWYLPSAIHLALIHGADMLSALPVPLGMLSEEPLESSHKITRNMRQFHTRKRSREATMSDLFMGMLVQTDPIIASLRRPAKSKGPLDTRVVCMLVAVGDGEGVSSKPPQIIDDSDSEVDEPDSL